MAIHYVKQQVGVADGTVSPPLMADAREVNAEKKSILASKVTGTAWAAADTVYLGKKPEGYKVTRIVLTTDTSLGSATLDIGTADNGDKYVDGVGLTATNVPTALGPLASTLDDDPGAEEELWATVNTATIASGTVLTFEIEMVGL